MFGYFEPCINQKFTLYIHTIQYSNVYLDSYNLHLYLYVVTVYTRTTNWWDQQIFTVNVEANMNFKFCEQSHEDEEKSFFRCFFLVRCMGAESTYQAARDAKALDWHVGEK